MANYNYNQAKVQRAVDALRKQGYNAENYQIEGTDNKHRVLIHLDDNELLSEEESLALEQEVFETHGVECSVLEDNIILVDDEEEEEVYDEAV